MGLRVPMYVEDVRSRLRSGARGPSEWLLWAYGFCPQGKEAEPSFSVTGYSRSFLGKLGIRILGLNK